MKHYEYKEITLGGLVATSFDKGEALSQLGKEGWRLIVTFQIKHGPLDNSIELRGIVEREVSNVISD